MELKIACRKAENQMKSSLGLLFINANLLFAHLLGGEGCSFPQRVPDR